MYGIVCHAFQAPSSSAIHPVIVDYKRKNESSKNRASMIDTFPNELMNHLAIFCDAFVIMMFKMRIVPCSLEHCCPGIQLRLKVCLVIQHFKNVFF